MDALTRHLLVKSAVIAGEQVMQKSASATPQQLEVLDSAWPNDERDDISPKQALAGMLATGLMVEEAEMAGLQEQMG